MKKNKILAACLSALAVCSLAIGFTACDKHEHVYTRYQTDATCTEKGVVWYECECGHRYLGPEYPALGHNYASYVYNNDATCMSNGTETAVCEHEGCEETNTRTAFNTALGHSLGDYVYNNDATCTSDGTETAVCEHEGCEYFISRGAWETQLEHTYDQEVVEDKYFKSEATCYEAATYYKSCTCGKKSETETFTHGDLAEHPMSDRWSYNTTHHWYSSTCSHEIQTDKAEHTVNQSGFCSVCDKPMTPTEGVVYELTTVSQSGGSMLDRWAEVTGYTGSAKRVIIVDKYEGAPVRYIRSGAFTRGGVTDVVIPDNVVYINKGAFGSSLKNVTLGAGVERIEENAFDSRLENVFIGNISSWCTMVGGGVSNFRDANLYYKNQLLTDIVIPETVTAIRMDAFYKCLSLTNVTINGGEIGLRAFYGCKNLKSVTFGDNVTSIGNYAFEGCDKLESVTLGNNVTSIGTEAFRDCENLKSVTINGGEIGNYAFYGCDKLENITFGENVTSIGAGAFAGFEYSWGHKDGDIILPDGITTIGDSAFGGRHIENITIGSGVTSIGARAFARYYLKNITVSEDNTAYKMDNGCLYTKDGTTLVLYVDSETNRSVELSDGLTTIMDEAFYRSNVTNVVLPESVTFIGDYAFGNCNGLVYTTVDGLSYLGNETNPYVYLAKADSTVTKANIQQGCKIIAAKLFRYGNLTEVTIPDSIVCIGEEAFNGCKATMSLRLNYCVIGEKAFGDCSNLASVTINGGSIGDSAFSDCSNLKTVTFGKGELSMDENAFGHVDNKLETVYITDIAAWCSKVQGVDSFMGKSKNLQHFYWDQQHSTDLVIPEGVTSIADGAFYNCEEITSVTIPNSVQSIGGFAFYNCEEITSVEIPGSVKSIGDAAFGWIWSLDLVIMDEGVTTIGRSAFNTASKVIVPKSVTSIDEDCFGNSFVFYCGTYEEATKITNWWTYTSDQKRGYYSETQPTDTLRYYWHYVDGVPTRW